MDFEAKRLEPALATTPNMVEYEQDDFVWLQMISTGLPLCAQASIDMRENLRNFWSCQRMLTSAKLYKTRREPISSLLFTNFSYNSN